MIDEFRKNDIITLYKILRDLGLDEKFCFEIFFKKGYEIEKHYIEGWYTKFPDGLRFTD